MMDVPTGFAGDLLTALRTLAVLIEPKLDHLFISTMGVFHLPSRPLFKINLPLLIVGIGLSSDLDMPFDPDIRRLLQPDRVWGASAIQETAM